MGSGKQESPLGARAGPSAVVNGPEWEELAEQESRLRGEELCCGERVGRCRQRLRSCGWGPLLLGLASQVRAQRPGREGEFEGRIYLRGLSWERWELLWVGGLRCGPHLFV